MSSLVERRHVDQAYPLTPGWRSILRRVLDRSPMGNGTLEGLERPQESHLRNGTR
jgi:hypothetical protein